MTFRLPVSVREPVIVNSVGSSRSAAGGDKYAHIQANDSATFRLDTNGIAFLNGLFIDALMNADVLTRRVTCSLWRQNRFVCTVISGEITAGQELKMSIGPDLDSYDAVVFAGTHFQTRSFFIGPFYGGDQILFDILNPGVTDTLSIEVSMREIND
jgi:hypothetical protein